MNVNAAASATPVVHFTLATEWLFVYAPPVDRQNIFGQLLFGIFSIISGLTVPKISP